MLWLPKAGRNRSWCSGAGTACSGIERRVALPLLSKVDRLRPAQPSRSSRNLVVPVRPFDQPDCDRRTATLDPIQEHPQLGLGLRMIGLNDDPHVRPVAELRLLQDPAEELVGQRPIGILLHVHMDIGAPFSGRPKDGPEPAGSMRDRRLGVDRLEVGGQARQLEREVDPRDRSVLIAVDEWDLGGGSQRPGQPVDHAQAGLLIPVGLGLADDGLAEQIGREGQAAPAECQDGLQRLVGRGPCDELPGHHPGRQPRRLGQPIRAGRALGHVRSNGQISATREPRRPPPPDTRPGAAGSIRNPSGLAMHR